MEPDLFFGCRPGRPGNGRGDGAWRGGRLPLAYGLLERLLDTVIRLAAGYALQKQYNNEMYKFGSAAREDSYPISLQAVWTADNGMLPPWKGDYHHDLNTQLSYWPAYTGNHLQEGMGYLNTLWEQRDVYKNIPASISGRTG